VLVDDKEVGAVGAGLCVLLGVASGDAREAAERLAAKVANLRVFENEAGKVTPPAAAAPPHRLAPTSAASPPALRSASKLDLSLLDVGGAALVVSQFTLVADTRKGNRPSFTDAAPPDQAEALYEVFCAAIEALGVPVARGVFGARMAVELVTDGPVTIVLDLSPSSASKLT
jgi:D-tyrosyl-tRNA(Tyr) deacylase